jgi:hypothetical protein
MTDMKRSSHVLYITHTFWEPIPKAMQRSLEQTFHETMRDRKSSAINIRHPSVPDQAPGTYFVNCQLNDTIVRLLATHAVEEAKASVLMQRVCRSSKPPAWTIDLVALKVI